MPSAPSGFGRASEKIGQIVGVEPGEASGVDSEVDSVWGSVADDSETIWPAVLDEYMKESTITPSAVRRVISSPPLFSWNFRSEIWVFEFAASVPESSMGFPVASSKV